MRGKLTTNMSPEEYSSWAVTQLGKNFSRTDFGDGQCYDTVTFTTKIRSDKEFRNMVTDWFNQRKLAIINEFGETKTIWKTGLDYLKSRIVGIKQQVVFREDFTKSIIANLPIYPDNIREEIGVNGKTKFEKAVSEEINHMVKSGFIRFEGKKVWLVKYDLEAVKSTSIR